jgi:UrcA family protein
MGQRSAPPDGAPPRRSQRPRPPQLEQRIRYHAQVHRSRLGRSLAGRLPTAIAAQTSSVTVETADLDLSTEAGKATLESRVQAAISRICGAVEVRKVREGGPAAVPRRDEASVRAEIARVTAKDTALAANR